MNKNVSLLLISLIPGLAVAATQDNSVDAYLLALNTAFPEYAEYTVQYKEAIETKCDTKLSASQLKSTAFSNVVSALLFSETVQKKNKDNNSPLRDTMNIVGKNIKCNDLNAPFQALLDDKVYQAKHERLSKLFHTLNAVTADKKD